MPTDTMNAEVYLSQLARRGVEYVFANAGTDFAPIIEALARQSGGVKYPRFVIVPHENLALSMAYGYYRATGKIAAVMCHVSVGTGNTVCGLMNAARDNVPILLAAGRRRTPEPAPADVIAWEEDHDPEIVIVEASEPLRKAS